MSTVCRGEDSAFDDGIFSELVEALLSRATILDESDEKDGESLQ